MTVAKSLSQILQAGPLHAEPGLEIFSLRVVLYRDARPRPEEHFWPANIAEDPRRPYENQTFQAGFVEVRVYTDRYTLQGDQPLYFHIDACAIKWNPFEIIMFDKTGGGGWGSCADAETLRELFCALRSFPAGWRRRVGLSTRHQESAEADVAATPRRGMDS